MSKEKIKITSEQRQVLGFTKKQKITAENLSLRASWLYFVYHNERFKPLDRMEQWEGIERTLENLGISPSSIAKYVPRNGRIYCGAQNVLPQDVPGSAYVCGLQPFASQK